MKCLGLTSKIVLDKISSLPSSALCTSLGYVPSIKKYIFYCTFHLHLKCLKHLKPLLRFWIHPDACSWRQLCNHQPSNRTKLTQKSQRREFKLLLTSVHLDNQCSWFLKFFVTSPNLGIFATVLPSNGNGSMYSVVHTLC